MVKGNGRMPIPTNLRRRARIWKKPSETLLHLWDRYRWKIGERLTDSNTLDQVLTAVSVVIVPCQKIPVFAAFHLLVPMLTER